MLLWSKLMLAQNLISSNFVKTAIELIIKLLLSSAACTYYGVIILSGISNIAICSRAHPLVAMVIEFLFDISGTAHDGSRSINESATWDYDYADSGINYADSIAESVTKFVLRFVERVCLEADINTDHVKTLQSLVPGDYI